MILYNFTVIGCCRALEPRGDAPTEADAALRSVRHAAANALEWQSYHVRTATRAVCHMAGHIRLCDVGQHRMRWLSRLEFPCSEASRPSKRDSAPWLNGLRRIHAGPSVSVILLTASIKLFFSKLQFYWYTSSLYELCCTHWLWSRDNLLRWYSVAAMLCYRYVAAILCCRDAL